jgi:tetratricopeptide (TPR) repeat protein
MKTEKDDSAFSFFPSAFLACVAVWLPAAGLSAGCHFRGEGPVPRSLVLSRQLSQQGLSAMERGNWTRADELLAQAVKVSPQDAEARYRYAEVLWQRKDHRAALEQIDKALQLAPDDPKILLRAAQMRIAMDQVQQAGMLIDKAIDADPKNPAVWALRGQLRSKSGDLRDALVDYHRALGYRPDDRETLLEVAEVYRRLNQPQRALAALQTLSETYPPGEETPQILYLTGLAYSALGRYAEAADCLSQVQTRGPATSEILYWLADAQLKAGQQSAARQTAAQLLSLDPRHAGGLALAERIDLAQHGLTAGYR